MPSSPDPVRGRLHGKAVVVTGGGKGLGRALVLAFAEHGADVAFSYRESRAGGEEVAGELRKAGRRVIAERADARERGALAAFVDRAAAHLGGIDVLVNNVGVFRRVALEDLAEDVLEEAFAVNVTSAVMASKAAAPHMRRRGGGAIVNVASLGAFRAWRTYLPYCASKAALVMATQCLAVALAPEIRVNAVAPGILDPPGAGEAVRGRIPQGRFGSLDEAVEVVLFLAAGAAYTTGDVVKVDGGRALV